MDVKFKGNTPPRYMSEGAAGADLAAKVGYAILPGVQVMIDTGVAIQLPENTAGLLVPRSSLCNKQGLQFVNYVGILDEDFTGTIKFCYNNTSNDVVTILAGERIGQVVVVPYIKANFIQVDKLETTVRGDGGYGSTGK